MKKLFNKKLFIILTILILLISAFLIYDYYQKKPRIITILFTQDTDLNTKKSIIESFGGRLYIERGLGICDVTIPKNLEFSKIKKILESNPHVESIFNEPFFYDELD